MDIVMHSMGMPFDGETIKNKSLGGSETACYYQALELAKRGHRVIVYTTQEGQALIDGVTYSWCGNASEQYPLGEQFEFYARNTPCDVLIIQRHPAAFHKPFASKVNVLQLHDLAIYRTAGMINHGMWQTDVVTVVSEFHKKQVCEVLGLRPEFVQVVPNGVDPALYELPFVQKGGFDTDKLSVTDGRIEWPMNVFGSFKMLYQSRPERGLEHLVRPGGIMDRLRDTNAHLLYCGYDNTVPQMRAYYDKLNAWAKELPNVTNLGALTKAQLAALQKSCDLLVYPSEFQEVSCITAMESMHAGLPMLASNVGALPETCEGAGVFLIDLQDGKCNEDKFVSFIENAVRLGPGYDKDGLGFRQREAAKQKTWVNAVDRMEEVLNNAMVARQGHKAAVLRHGIEHSDVEFVEQLHYDARGAGGIEERAKEEIRELYQFRDSAEAFKAHYDLHGGKYYDSFEDKVVGEDVTSTSRFRGVAMHFYEEVASKTSQTLRVLDYGCAHGHYLIPLAKAFPTAKFSGMDVSARAIGAARRWVDQERLDNVEELIVGSQERLMDFELMCPLKYDDTSELVNPVTGIIEQKEAVRQLYDVIIAGEILEHVVDWHELLSAFAAILKPDGLIIATTPYGRWEWSGTEAFRGAREHLHHFERRDILEICGANPCKIMYAPAGNDKTGKVLGSWVWSVRTREGFGEIDMARKLAQLAPRQTVSACLIVKDGEKTIRKCIESFVEWVDEIIVCIDPATKDRTRLVLEQLQGDYRWKPIFIDEGVEALKDGFDEARNHSISLASGEWVLWLDADEEVQQAWNLWKYLRPSEHDAIGFPQIHYSTNPPEVLTTDYPCRLFRRKEGMRFYGVVHEHVEIAPGKSIPFATVRHDVQFLHTGYIDEATRRARFQRNLPLLYRDLEKWPDRLLNGFLHLRDIAQLLAFEQEQTGGYVVEGQIERAQKGIDMFGAMLERKDLALRMIVDAVKYYSHCVAVTGTGFNAKFAYQVGTEQAPDLACNMQVEGRFASKDHFTKLLLRLNEEATRHYESQYL